MPPELSVIMSVYNGEEFLEESINSILSQTFGDFEFIILDDGSSDRSREIILSKASEDSRITLFVNEQNIGLTRSLNRGLKLAVGRFIARQDADDISDRDRFAKQLEVLRRDSEIGVVGSAAQVIDEFGVKGNVHAVPLHDTDIRWQLLFRNVFKHASVIIRSKILQDNELKYNEELPYAQDYDLWSRMSCHCKMANVADPLIRYRIHRQQVSSLYLEKQQQLADTIGRGAVKRLGIEISLAEQKRLRQWTRELPSDLTLNGMKFCKAYFVLLDRFAQQPHIEIQKVSNIRKFLVRHILASVSLAQARQLISSGLLLTLMKNQFTYTLFWPLRSLVDLLSR